MSASPRSVRRAAAIAGLVALSACGTSSGSGGSSAGSSAASVDRQQVIDALAAAKTRCNADVDARYPAATAYYRTNVDKGTRDGRFDRRYRQDFLASIGERRQCRVDYLNQLGGQAEAYYIDLNRAQMAEDVAEDTDLANGRLSFVRYRAAQAALWGKLESDLAAQKAIQVAAAQQRAAEQAAEDQRQAEADAEEQERNNVQTTAMMGMMMA